MNKRADIPTIVLIIATISLFALALLTFFLSDLKSVDKITSAKLLDSVLIKQEKFYFYKNIGRNNEQAASLSGVRLEGDSIVVKEDFYKKRFPVLPWTEKAIEVEYRFQIPGS